VFCAQAIEDVTEENSTSSDESSRRLRV